MTVASAKGAKAKADRLFSRLIRSRGRCERCNESPGPYDTAHIIGRRFSWTRTDERNAWCLCKKCHWTVDNYSVEHVDLVRRTLGLEVYAELRAKSEQVGAKFDWPAEVERLTALLKDAA